MGMLEAHAAGLKGYQKTILFSVLGGFPAWTIVMFSLLCFMVPLCLSLYVLDHPGQGDLDLDPKTSYPMKVWVTTTCANIFITLFAMWSNVFMAARGNSFSKNPEDWNTGDTKVGAKLAGNEEGLDLDNARWARIHNNLLENVPITVLLGFAMVLCRPSNGAVKCFLVPYPIIRSLHTFWYWIAGSHEIRATLFSAGLFCNYGCMAQCLVYIYYF